MDVPDQTKGTTVAFEGTRPGVLPLGNTGWTQTR